MDISKLPDTRKYNPDYIDLDTVSYQLMTNTLDDNSRLFLLDLIKKKKVGTPVDTPKELARKIDRCLKVSKYIIEDGLSQNKACKEVGISGKSYRTYRDSFNVSDEGLYKNSEKIKFLIQNNMGQ